MVTGLIAGDTIIGSFEEFFRVPAKEKGASFRERLCFWSLGLCSGSHQRADNRVGALVAVTGLLLVEEAVLAPLVGLGEKPV
jgi:hypothetical protein